jgi:hypothetical protein
MPSTDSSKFIVPRGGLRGIRATAAVSPASCAKNAQASDTRMSRFASLDEALERGPNTILNNREAAMALTCSIHTLNQWRWKRKGPRYIDIGPNKIGYRAGDLLAYITGRTVNTD